MKILLAIIAIFLFAAPTLTQERAHGFDEQARDAALLSALQTSDPYARRFQPKTSDLSTAPNGTVWYRTDTDVVKVKLNSGVVSLTGAGGSPGGSNGQIQYNNSGVFGGLAVPLSVSNGGTGQASYTNGQLLIGNTTGNTLTKATLTAGANVTVTNGGGSITLASTAWAPQGWEDTGAVRQVAAASTQYNCLLRLHLGDFQLRSRTESTQLRGRGLFQTSSSEPEAHSRMTDR
jgi:hypothetical protein